MIILKETGLHGLQNWLKQIAILASYLYHKIEKNTYMSVRTCGIREFLEDFI